METFPRVAHRSSVDPTDVMGAIDFVNRVNWLFETWDIDAMVEAFLPDGVAFHFHGTIRGQGEMRGFFERDYPYLIPGVSRHATNHIVDADGDGVAVRYQNLLIRYAPVTETVGFSTGKVLESSDELPAIWLYSPMIDRLRRTDAGWRIFERYIGGSTFNSRLNASDHDAAALAPFMPRL